jgi:hypothetical protein
MFLAAFTSALQAYPQAVHRKLAWLSREFRSTCPHAEQRWLVYAGLIFCTRPGALSSRRRTSSPQPLSRMARFSPALARTFEPGPAVVPLADRVMLAIFRSSTRMTSNLRARLVEVFSHQSFRASASRALSRAIAVLACCLLPRLALASRRCNSLSRARLKPGASSSYPVDSAADTATPRSTPTIPPVPGPGTGSGIAANATCRRPARSIVTR